jgi:uncharacterized membrane protein YvlD (DUF360 family)
MLPLTAWLAPGFRIDDFVAALIGAIVLAPSASWITNCIWQKPDRQADNAAVNPVHYAPREPD